MVLNLPIIYEYSLICWINNKDMGKSMFLRRYIIYGLIGICLEIFWTGLESLLNKNYTMEAKTSVWMFFIYGLAVFFEPIHHKIKGLNPMIRGSLYMIIIYTVEFLTGGVLKIILGVCPWNYADWGSIYGLITLSFMPVWSALGFIFERIHYGLDTIGLKLEL